LLLNFGGVSGVMGALASGPIMALTGSRKNFPLWQIILVPACGFPLVGCGDLWWVMKYGKQEHAMSAPLTAAGDSPGWR